MLTIDIGFKIRQDVFIKEGKLYVYRICDESWIISKSVTTNPVYNKTLIWVHLSVVGVGLFIC